VKRRGVTPSEINKSDSDEQKKLSVFQKKINRGDTAELIDRQTVMMTKKVVSFLSGKNRGDSLSCRPGCHKP